jgi:hypothetical protein
MRIFQAVALAIGCLGLANAAALPNLGYENLRKIPLLFSTHQLIKETDKKVPCQPSPFGRIRL